MSIIYVCFSPFDVQSKHVNFFLTGTVRAQTNREYESIDETQRLIGSTDDITETDGLSNLSNSASSHDVFSSTI